MTSNPELRKKGLELRGKLFGGLLGERSALGCCERARFCAMT
jgi:hypothetical protein